MMNKIQKIAVAIVFAAAGIFQALADGGIVSVRCAKSVECAEALSGKGGKWWTIRSAVMRELYREAVREIAARAKVDAREILGADVVAQSETCENGVYTLAIDVEWAPAMTEAASRFKRGEYDVRLDEKTLAEIARKDDAAAAQRIGPRQFVDAAGEVCFVGFSAMALGSNNVLRERNKLLAQQDAREMAMLSLFPEGDFAAESAFEQVYWRTVTHPVCTNFPMCVYAFALTKCREKGATEQDKNAPDAGADAPNSGAAKVPRTGAGATGAVAGVTGAGADGGAAKVPRTGAGATGTGADGGAAKVPRKGFTPILALPPRRTASKCRGFIRLSPSI